MKTNCIYPWTKAFVEYDGSVRPCCSTILFGSLANQTLPEAFCSPEANRIRQLIVDEKLPACKNCLSFIRRPKEAAEKTFDWFFQLSDRQLDELKQSAAGIAFLKNYQLIKQAYLGGQALPPGCVPLQVMIQLGLRCNLRCVMCPQEHTGENDIDPGFIEKVKQWIPYLHGLDFTGGEPLVYDSFWDLADYFRRHAVPTAKFSTLTNAALLTEKRIHDHLEGTKRLHIGVNIDSCKKETYEKIRVGANWEGLMRNLHDYQRIGRESRGKWDLSFGFTIMRSNITQLRGAIELAAGLGAGLVCGMISGDFGPAKNCRTYFKENIFRFSHLGFTREQIVSVLEDAMEAADKLDERYRTITKANINGVIEYAQTVERIDIPQAHVISMLALNDENLSQMILAWIKKSD